MPSPFVQWLARSGRVVTPLAFAPVAAALLQPRLVRSDPAAGAELARPPEAVRLWFSEHVDGSATRVRLVGPRGAVALGAVQRLADKRQQAGAGAGEFDEPRMPTRPGRVPEDVVAAVVRGPMPPGRYRVEWRTTAADGRAVAGRLTFRVARPAAAR